MKKVLVLFTAVFMSGLSSNAYVDTQYMVTEQYMKNTGYSSEMARMISVTNQDPYREPYVEKRDFKSLVKRAYSYLIPATNTDLDFYNHDGNFNNPSWKDL